MSPCRGLTSFIYWTHFRGFLALVQVSALDSFHNNKRPGIHADSWHYLGALSLAALNPSSHLHVLHVARFAQVPSLYDLLAAIFRFWKGHRK
jgi:hypothetical protein